MLAVDPTRSASSPRGRRPGAGPPTGRSPTPVAPVFARALQRKRIASRRRAITGDADGRRRSRLSHRRRPPPLKLYQPAHQRFYLVTASLVCQLAGLAGSRARPGAAGTRRPSSSAGCCRGRSPAPTADPATADEYAFVGGRRRRTAGGSRRSRRRTAAVVAGEEQLRSFHAAFAADDGRQAEAAGGPRAGRASARRISAASATSGGPAAAAATPPAPPIIDPRSCCRSR